MILLRESRRQARHSEAILSSPPALLRPSLPGLLLLPVVLGAVRVPESQWKWGAQLEVVLMEERKRDDGASCIHLECPQVCLPKERGRITQ